MDIPIGGDSAYFLLLLARYRRDPTSVPADWAVHFETLDDAGNATERSAGDIVERLLEGYRRFGHFEAKLDPLSAPGATHPVLARLRQAVAMQEQRSVTVNIGGRPLTVPAAKADAKLKAIYSDHVALEANHLESVEEADWIYSAFENAMTVDVDMRLVGQAITSVLMADTFETFMRTKFPTKKRFGSEGSESSIVFLRELLWQASAAEISDVVIGGMHRGRLATLAAALGKNPAILAGELKGRDLSDDPAETGDVPYHLGLSSDLIFDRRRLRATLLPHPSHLMVVAPVSLGCARGTAVATGDTLSFMMHTDAAFSGQGLTMELLQIGGLNGYSAGGTIHLVVNNQIGFTSLPSEGRSSRYCTDVAKTIGAPVVHVNADDAIAVASVANLAMSYRAKFRKDIVVDLVCYRRYGHNELDEPRFTQPSMWSDIDAHPTLRTLITTKAGQSWPEQLAVSEKAAEDFLETLRAGFDMADTARVNDTSIQSEEWKLLAGREEAQLLSDVSTGMPLDSLRSIGRTASHIPEKVDANDKVRRFYASRTTTIEEGADINFATAEALAFATLMAENHRVRLSGQDAVRGTFTQRHLAVHDRITGQVHIPVDQAAIRPGLGEFINSPLSEYGVLGFEYGYSLVDPHALTIWEAQFGDFLNGAQILVDQYLVSAESKWQLRSGIVLSLPHGLEGQGPDHSSARIERILQLYADANFTVAQPSTPANLFHLLRRQIKAPWRKPLFLISPKSLLRAKAAVSELAEMGEGTSFRPVLIDAPGAPEHVRRVILCSGKVYYALREKRHALNLMNQVVLIRVEQLAPFPAAILAGHLANFPEAEVVWCQEEAQNQGVWSFAKPYLEQVREVSLVSRPAMSVCAGGSIERHEREQADLMDRALEMSQQGKQKIARQRQPAS